MSKGEWKKLSKNEWKKWLDVVGRVLLAYAVVFAQGAWAGQDQATRDKSDSPQKAAAQPTGEKQPSVATSAKAQTKQAQGEESESTAAEEKASRDGSHEAIKVHGHWTIEVRNPDGTLVTHREFENSFTQSTGAPLLASLLNLVGQTSVPGSVQLVFWAVELGGSACSTLNNTGFPNSGGPGTCRIVPAGVFGNPLYAGLDFASSNKLGTGPSAGSFVLSGTVQASDSSPITSVTTETINAVVSPLTVNQFTSRPLDGLNGDPQPVSVNAGQTIAVTVNISFS